MHPHDKQQNPAERHANRLSLSLLALLVAAIVTLPGAMAIGVGFRCTGMTSAGTSTVAVGIGSNPLPYTVGGVQADATLSNCTYDEQDSGTGIWTWILSIDVLASDIDACGDGCDGYRAPHLVGDQDADETFVGLLGSTSLSFQDYCGNSASLADRLETAQLILAGVRMASVSVEPASCAGSDGLPQEVYHYAFEAQPRVPAGATASDAAVTTVDVARAEYSWPCHEYVVEDHWYSPAKYGHTTTGSLTLSALVMQAVIKSDDLKADPGEGKCTSDNLVHEVLDGNAAGTILVAVPVCGTVSVAGNEIPLGDAPIIGEIYLAFGFNAHFTGHVGTCNLTRNLGLYASAPVIGVEGYGDFNLP